MPPFASSFQKAAAGLTPRFSATDVRITAKVVMPEDAVAPLHIEDVVSGMSVDVTLKDARKSLRQVVDGYVLYPRGHVSGATLIHRPLPSGIEDFLSFEDKPQAASVAYQVELAHGVSGLRLVSNTLEFLDKGGAPRLRIDPPYLVGGDEIRTDARLAVLGCAVDGNPAAPWGRHVTAPGARRCTVTVSWRAEGVVYPALLDPRWTNTGNMVTARQDHTATILAGGKVLVAAGRSSSATTTALATAELFDRTTGTWATTGSMTGARWSHTAVQLGTTASTTTSTKVLIAGGLNGTTSQNTAQLYSVSAGTWTAAANLNVARHFHTATVLADGRVLVAGGMTNTTILNTAAIYNAASGTGTWTAVATNMSAARRFHTATLLVVPGNSTLNNKVLIVGGNSTGTTSLATIDLFDGTSAWAASTARPPSLPSTREGHTATLLANGNLLLTGGRSGTGTLNTTVLLTAATGIGSWASAGNMTIARQQHTATLLPAALVKSGQVLVVGGSNGTAAHGNSELWNGITTWTGTAADSLSAPAQGHTATLVSTGAVLIAGGFNSMGTIRQGQIYDPSFAVACTSNSQCSTGFCASGVCCNAACTDQCSACNLAGLVGTCSPKTNGTTCNDTNGCTQTDTCQAGICTGANPKVCAASDSCHLAGTCAPATGVCSNPTKAVGATCDDGNLCTQTDTCSSTFVCVGANPRICTAADQCHDVGTCAPATGVCSSPQKTDGVTCNDSNACTQTDSCQAGVCTGANPKVCAASDSCHLAGTCAPATGVCSNPTKAVGASCDDGNLCTQTDTCSSTFVCTGGNPKSCPASDQCHAPGTCAAGTGACTNPLKANGATCDDNNPCTSNDTCQSGACAAGGATGFDDGNPCTADSCNASGGVTHTNLADWTTCADSNACDGVETCHQGVCTHETPGGATTCAGGTKVTFYQSFDNGTVVDIAASSRNPREPDQLVKVPGLFGMAEDASTYPWISYATSVQQSPTNIVLSKPGSVSMWVKPSSQFTPATFLVAFDNNAGMKLDVVGSAANGIAAAFWASDGHYIVGATAPWTADDRWHLIVVNWSRYSIACSVDGGAPVTTASNELPQQPLAPVPSNLGNLIYPMAGATGYAKDELLVLNRPMTAAEVQWYYSQRLAPAAANPAIARFQSDTTSCNAADDLNPCTDDSCAPATGIAHATAATGTVCSDGNACNGEELCQSGVCNAGPSLDTDDGNVCTTDSCSPLLGVEHKPVSSATSCDDGNRCTVGDSCNVGICQPGAATECAAGTSYYAPLIDLGAFGDFPAAYAINNAGDVVGSGNFPAPPGGPRPHAFRYTEGGAIEPIFPDDTWSYGWGLNSTSKVAVGAIAAGGKSFSQAPGQPPTLHTTWESANTWAINDNGQEAGEQYAPGSPPQAFRFSPPNLLPTSLGMLPGLQFSGTSGRAIDSQGRVAGYAIYPPPATGVWRNWWDKGHAIIYSDADGLRDLSDLKPSGSAFSTLSVATAISGTLVAGWGMRSDGSVHGFRYHTDGGAVEDIGGLPAASAPYSAVYGMNAAGTVVGVAFSAPEGGNDRAFIRAVGDVVRDLNDYVDPQSSWVLSAATAINDNNEVVGYGTHGAAGTRPFKMKLPTVAGCPVSANTCQGPGTRDLITDQCVYSSLLDGSVCDDGNPSTNEDTCRSGTCWGTVHEYPLTTAYASLSDLGIFDGADSVSVGGLNAPGDVAFTEVSPRGNTLVRYKGLTRSLEIIPTLPADSAVKDWMATGIDDLGAVVGSTGWHGEAFVANPGQAAQIFTGGHGYAYAAAINGQRIAGSEPVYDSNSAYAGYVSALRRDANGTKYYVGKLQGATLAGGTHSGTTDALGISPAGDLVGFAQLTEPSRTFSNGFVFAPGWGMREAYRFTFPYTAPGDRQNLNDYAAASGWQLLYMAQASNGPLTVGWGVIGGLCHAFRYTSGTNQILDLGTLPSHPGSDVCDDHAGRTNYYYPTAVNAGGEIVGSIAYGGAFYYSDAIGRMVDLQDVVDPSLQITLMTASGINENHQVVGLFTFANDSKLHVYKIGLPNWLTRPLGADGTQVSPLSDGIVDVGGGQYAVVFGYRNDSGAEVQLSPGPGSNTFARNGSIVSAPVPAPPTRMADGIHRGTFLPRGQVGEVLTWTIAGKPMSVMIAPSTNPPLAHVPIGTTGYGVNVPDSSSPGGVRLVTVEADLVQFAETPADPAPQPAADPAVEAPFKGTLNGQLKVGPTGAATYTVPISIPPGIAGMVPSLSLVYDSQGQNGAAGQGWDLTGLSTIHLCAKTQASDGQTVPVGTPATSILDQGVCLDGKRLFATLASNPSTVVEYRSERDDFSQIKATRQPDASYVFTVLLKTGEVRSYGSTDASRVKDTNLTAVWALDRVSDIWGNYYEIHYNNDLKNFTTDGLIVTSIAYTGHTATGGAAIPPFETVHFSWEARPDVRTVRFGTLTVPKVRRLATISSSRGTYTLHYMDPSAMLPSRLDRISFCKGSSCLDPEGSLVFSWDWGNYGWEEWPGFRPPISMDPSDGTQFLDLDGDGRLDIVRAKDGVPSGAWRNNGQGWEAAPDAWKLPFNLYKADGAGATPSAVPHDVLLADVNGDGMLDIVGHDRSTDLGCDVVGGVGGAEQPPCRLDIPLVHLGVKGGGWSTEVSSYRFPQNQPMWPEPSLIGQNIKLADLNGDGKADVVRFDVSSNRVTGYINTGTGWRLDPSYAINTLVGGAISEFNVVDINRDGLADLVGPEKKLADNCTTDCAYFYAYMNLGTGRSNAWNLIYDQSEMPGKNRGDVDGDGFYDFVRLAANYSATTADPKVVFSKEVHYGTTGPTGYIDSLTATVPTTFMPTADHFAFQLVDLNSDGLVDLVRNHPAAGYGLQESQAFVNTGTRWTPLQGTANWQASAGPNPIPVGTPLTCRAPYMGGYVYSFQGTGGPYFIDLDGDGVKDVVQSSSCPLGGRGGQELNSKAWHNTFRPPVIAHFPNGLAQNSDVTYAVITTAVAQTKGLDQDAPTYQDNPALARGLGYLTTVPLRVVKSVSIDNGTGTKNPATYAYTSLRASTSGRGALGFASVTVSEPAGDSSAPVDPRGQVTVTSYAQIYPYTGLPTSVLRTNGGLISSTSTLYCDGTGASPQCTPMTGVIEGTVELVLRPRFVYPKTVTDLTVLRTLPGAPTEVVRTTTESQFDDWGNVVKTTVNTEKLGGDPAQKTFGEKYRKEIVNVYGAAGSADGEAGGRLAKPTSTIVTSTRVAPADGTLPISHQTDFTYLPIGSPEWSAITGHQPLALRKTAIEPGAPASRHVELHTAYGYDRFGNVVITTACGSDFDNCSPGAAGPSASPFRTSRVSFEHDDYLASSGQGALSYGSGRFPVKTTNPAGQVSYFAYDTNVGMPIVEVGPNGAADKTCRYFDTFEHLAYEILRCGSSASLMTTYDRYHVPAAASGSRSSIVEVVHRQGDAGTWIYKDVLGRTTMTRSKGFDGRIVEALTVFDALGRVFAVSKPAFQGDTRYFTINSYDTLNRPRQVVQQLGVIDGGGAAKATAVITVYEGSTIATTQTVAGVSRTRKETKNLLGKVQRVLDAKGVEMSYQYDVEGRLTDSIYAPSNSVVHLEYDERGRKIFTTDPDLGTWQYTYNNFGDLESQRDPKEQVTTMVYDALGRVTAKTTAAGTAKWLYDAPNGGIGKVAAMVSAPDDRLKNSCLTPAGMTGMDGKRATRTYSYNDLGELTSMVECIDGESFVTDNSYDGNARLRTVKYPQVNNSRLALEYHYTPLGFLHFVSDEGTPSSVYWAATAMNAAGQITTEHARNGVETVSHRNPSTGWLMDSLSTARADGDKVIQKWGYGFDEVGSLRTRSREDAVNPAHSLETFGYDDLDRLQSARTQVFAASLVDTTESYEYDDMGNLKKKGAKQYTYGAPCEASGRPAGPHAVCTVDGGTPFTYDADGNALTASGRSITYNASNKASRIESGGATVELIYGADDNRIVQSAVAGTAAAARTVYVGMGSTGKGLYERTTRGTAVEHAQFLYAGGSHLGAAFALRIVKTDGASSVAPELRYYHTDHLGSVTAMSDESGRVVDAAWGGANATVMGYDAWGNRRNPEGTTASAGSFATAPGRREFTGQEAIPGVGLINMNGRVYDATLGRFLSPDPTIQFIDNLQSYNRYSYVLNNPLRYTDPTGYSITGSGTGDFLVGITISVVGLVACVGTEGAGCGVAFAALGAYWGALSALSNGASFTQVVEGAAINFVAGQLGGAAGGSGIGGAIVSGAVSGAVSAAYYDLRANRDLGWDVLSAAATGASMSAASWTVSFAAAGVSEASRLEAEGGGDDDLGSFGKGRRGRYTGGDHDAVVCGERGVKCGGPANPKLDAIAQQGLQQTHAVPGPTGIDGVDDVQMPIKQATGKTGREYAVLVLRDKNGNVHYSQTAVGSRDEVTYPSYRSDQKVIAMIHTHPGGAGEQDFFSVMDANGATRAGVPNYVWSQSQGKVMVFTPASGNTPANIRYLP